MKPNKQKMNHDNKKENKKVRLRNITLTTLGWELALPIFGGVLIGFHLDNFFDTNYALTFGLLIIGIITGYYNLIKLIELEMLRTKAAKKCHKINEVDS